MITTLCIFAFILIFYSDRIAAIDDDGPPRVRTTNKEPEVLEYLKQYRESYRRSLQNQRRLKPLLIATFINASRASSREIFYDNLERLENIADFAAVLYDGSPRAIRNFCGIREQSPTNPITYCRRAAISYSPDVKFIPKPLLYQDLLPYLPRYRKVLLIDEDISLSEFNATQFLHIWDCAFFPNHNPKLRLQGLHVFDTSRLP